MHLKTNQFSEPADSDGTSENFSMLESNDQNNDTSRQRQKGHVIHCDGKVAIIAAMAGTDAVKAKEYWAVGQLMSIIAGKSRVVGLVYNVELSGLQWHENEDNQINVHMELIGEIYEANLGKLQFSSGISTYPPIGAVAHRIRSDDLALIYENDKDTTVRIGSITQDSSIPALITIDRLLSRHFAIVGTTGVGKSTAVALILHKIVIERPDIRMLVLDPHNEFASAFPDKSIRVDAASLDLPFWMFTLEEFVEVIYRGRAGIGEELDVLRDLIPEAKIRYESARDHDKAASLKDPGNNVYFTADTPVPYRIQDLIGLIDEKIGLLEKKADRPHLKSLKFRIESIMNDPRFKFMFNGNSNADSMDRMLSHVFRIPQNDKPICVFELSGLPSEVVNVVASVMCRLAFDLGISSQGAIQTLVVCEESHRYIPKDKDAGFLPTRMAIARIAKEGRKYGVYLGVITQRPGELDPTILSQCNTIFSMRLGNEYDQEIVRQAITGAARSTVSFLSSLANRECIAFGEAIDSPMRMIFDTVPFEELPGSHIYENQENIRSGTSKISLSKVIKTMRLQGRPKPSTPDNSHSAFETLSAKIIGEQRPSVNPNDQRAPSPSRLSGQPAPAAYQPGVRDEPPRASPQRTLEPMDHNHGSFLDQNPVSSQPPKPAASHDVNLIRQFRRK